MTIDRRAFLAGTALVAVTPTFRLLPPLPATATAGAPVLMIAGWSAPDDTDLSNQVWMTVGHGWRTAWR
jgi:hypothetical protein